MRTNEFSFWDFGVPVADTGEGSGEFDMWALQVPVVGDTSEETATGGNARRRAEIF
jgi:hypothetical protein